MGVQPSVRHIGKYEVIDVIGTGGMGIVFRAHDPTIGRTVAIKMLRKEDTKGNTGLFDRFFSREMKSTGNLHHKNIVTVYDSGEQDGNPYLVMEYLEGDALSKVIAERRPIPLIEKLDVVVQVCDGLQYAHDCNIIHRDVKPANVILLRDGTAKIVDFGVARIAGGGSTLVQAGQLVGSLYYLSPEQINSLPIDARSDIFSTGILLYEFLTWELPFKGTDPASTFAKILTEEPRPLSQLVRDAPPAMQMVISRALAKKVNDRYQTAEELGFEILAVQKQVTSDMIADCMKRAEAAMQRHDLDRARVHLLEVVRLDRQNEPANRLLREVRKTIQQEQRSSQIVQIRSQAQVALAGCQYEEALACADQALKLDPADIESIRLSEEIGAAISRARAVRDALNRAESALFAGDFDEAKDAVEESLRLDPADTEARALATVVNKELTERARRQRVQEFVDQARRGIADRHFGEAVEALHQAEELDPSDSNVRELLQWAERGQEQEKRRKDLLEITDQIEKALHNGDFSSACTISEMGLRRFPDDPTLARLRGISEKQRDIVERRRFVQDQSLAAKTLKDQGRLAEAIEILVLALKKYPGEPNLESQLAGARAEQERLQLEREEAARREELQREEEQARAQRDQRVLDLSIDLRRSLDTRVPFDRISADASKLRTAIDGTDIDDNARNAADLVLEEVHARLRARDNAIAELEQLRSQIEQVQNIAALPDGESRLRSIKATFPNEKDIQSICTELGNALARLGEEHDRRISLLTSLVESIESAPAGELVALQHKACELGAVFADDARIGVLLQQIESRVSQRLGRRAMRARDMESLFTDLACARSLQELARIVDRARSITALDRTDEELGERSEQLQSEAARLRTLLESLLGQMTDLAGQVASAATIIDAEAVVPLIRSLANQQPDFRDLQEAAMRLLAQVQGRRIEHDLIVKELESTYAALSANESDEELSLAATRAAECRALHRNDPTILPLSAKIETSVERILRERAELRERTAACDAALQSADELVQRNDPGAALEKLLSVEAQNPDRADLQQRIASVQKLMERLRIEQERRERERLAEEKAVAERRAAERAAAERLEQVRIGREKADAEARARLAASDQAIEQARGLLVHGKGEESLAVLLAAVQQDPGSSALRTALEATRSEITRQQGERERLAREKADKERAEQEQLNVQKATRSTEERDVEGGERKDATAVANEQKASAKINDSGLLRGTGSNNSSKDTLQIIELQLAAFIGPLAKILVKQAAAKAADVAELYALLASKLDQESDQRAFLAKSAELAAGKVSLRPPSTLSSSETGPASDEITSTALEKTAQTLARFLGPIATVLVKREAKRATTLRNLQERLAEHIVDSAERQRFLSAFDSKERPIP
jgi:eukaryotic-like serine/threonine-protein kinase